jgi:hypothetical protein
MKLIILVITLLFSFSGSSTETANAVLSCYSLQFQSGDEPNGNYFLDLTSLSGTANGELALDFLASGYTHSAYLSLVDEVFGETLSGQLVLDVPPQGDANKDGFSDFFQVNQGVTNLISSGAYNLEIYGRGSVTAVWNRPAGSNYGTCSLSIKLMQPVTFNHTFQLLEYSGPFVYAPSSTNISGVLNLAQAGHPSARLEGPVQFVRSTIERFNQLSLMAGVCTNESQQALNYISQSYFRDPAWPTNYYGYLEFIAPDNPSAFFPYGVWLLSIDDPNDMNHNGIPDLSDDPILRPRAPRLELARDRTNLVLTVHGDVGSVNEIQSVSDLKSTNWQTQLSVTITNDPESVELPSYIGATTFWKVRTQ